MSDRIELTGDAVKSIHEIFDLLIQAGTIVHAAENLHEPYFSESLGPILKRFLDETTDHASVVTNCIGHASDGDES